MLGNNRPRNGSGSLDTRRAEDRLRRHAELTKAYIESGMEPDKASIKAFREIVTPKQPSAAVH